MNQVYCRWYYSTCISHMCKTARFLDSSHFVFVLFSFLQILEEICSMLSNKFRYATFSLFGKSHIENSWYDGCTFFTLSFSLSIFRSLTHTNTHTQKHQYNFFFFCSLHEISSKTKQQFYELTDPNLGKLEYDIVCVILSWIFKKSRVIQSHIHNWWQWKKWLNSCCKPYHRFYLFTVFFIILKVFWVLLISFLFV